ncbi:hypothetical protein SESBI_18751 [Sesbania bispinosa]|nr:hypothetical protein SESBI_18751 [Sesbania bispinosa]
MGNSILLVVLLVVLAVTRLSLVYCRVHPSQEKATHEPVKGLKFPRKTKADARDNIKARVLIGSQVHTMSSGPSEKGSGH